MIIIIIILLLLLIMITTTITAAAATTIKRSQSKAQLEMFDNVLTVPRTVSDMFAQVTLATSRANHVQKHRARTMCQMCCVPRGAKGQLSH